MHYYNCLVRWCQVLSKKWYQAKYKFSVDIWSLGQCTGSFGPKLFRARWGQGVQTRCRRPLLAPGVCWGSRTGPILQVRKHNLYSSFPWKLFKYLSAGLYRGRVWEDGTLCRFACSPWTSSSLIRFLGGRGRGQAVLPFLLVGVWIWTGGQLGSFYEQLNSHKWWLFFPVSCREMHKHAVDPLCIGPLVTCGGPAAGALGRCTPWTCTKCSLQDAAGERARQKRWVRGESCI